jgi:hypothetical protein
MSRHRHFGKQAISWSDTFQKFSENQMMPVLSLNPGRPRVQFHE